MSPAPENPVRELRLVVTAQDYPALERLLGGALGLREVQRWDDPDGRGVVLEAGRASIEIIDVPQAARIDGIEAPGHVSGPIRLALRVDDSTAAAEALTRAGAALLGGPLLTPWNHENARLRLEGGLDLTLFTPRDTPRPKVELP